MIFPINEFLNHKKIRQTSKPFEAYMRLTEEGLIELANFEAFYDYTLKKYVPFPKITVQFVKLSQYNLSIVDAVANDWEVVE